MSVKKDWVKGVGGSFTSNFFFTNDLIFLDTPGKWVENGLDEDAEGLWNYQIDLLKKYRGHRPLDGLIVVVPAEDLLTKDDSRLREQACNIREVVDLFHEKLHFRFPI